MQSNGQPQNELLAGITWYHHASCLLERAGKRVYIDPWELPANAPIADLILVSHDHFDHYSVADIAKITGASTELVAPQSMFGKVAQKTRYVSPGDKRCLQGINLEVVPAYNEDKSFHPESSHWVGYIVEIAGRRYYHAGDSDYISEMDAISADVAFLPVGGTYTMDVDAAVKAANAIAPKLAIPIHWGKLVGSEEDALHFVQKFANGRILKPGQSY